MSKRDGVDSRGCTFCQIVAGSLHAEIIHETDSCIAFFPLKPATKGHTLVVPKRHIRDFLSVEPAIFAALSSTAVELGKALRSAFSPDGMNMITSSGEAASQSIMHLHVHLVPRWTGDSMGAIWPPQHHTDGNDLSAWAEEFRSRNRLDK